MSLRGGRDPRIMQKIYEAVEMGKIVICAAGNDGDRGQGTSAVGWPAKDPATVAIGSYNKGGELSDFSSRGKEVTVAFPGEDILSTWPGNTYRRISGTSMATPFCSGLVALLLAAQRKAERAGQSLDNPIRSNSDLITHLKNVAVDKGPSGHDDGWGWGVVDTDKIFDQAADDGVPDENLEDGDGLSLLGGFLKIRTVTVGGKAGMFIYVP